jgi:hypothetical protein
VQHWMPQIFLNGSTPELRVAPQTMSISHRYVENHGDRRVWVQGMVGLDTARTVRPVPTDRRWRHPNYLFARFSG